MSTSIVVDPAPVKGVLKYPFAFQPSDDGRKGRVWISPTLPKADMHIHISLAYPEDEFRRRIKAGRTNVDPTFLTHKPARYYPDLLTFHNTYEKIRSITGTANEMARVTQLYLERIAQEGAIYAELSNSFRNPADFKWQIEAITEGIERAKRNTAVHGKGIEARIVATVLRDHGPERAEDAASVLAREKFEKVTGFGLVGDEQANSLTEYDRALSIAWHEAGLGIVPHVAEQDIQNAVDFLDLLRNGSFDVKEGDQRRIRVGHGTLIHMSDSLMDEFAQRAICLETCLSANKRIGLPDHTRRLKAGDMVRGQSGAFRIDRSADQYYRDLRAHPLIDFMNRNIPVALGTDNPVLMNTSPGKESSQAYIAGAQDLKHHIAFVRNAIEHANVDAETRAELLSLVDGYVQEVDAGNIPNTTPLGYCPAPI